jgi:molybdopterin-guanine dinucleotide biosynthesis protein A
MKYKPMSFGIIILAGGNGRRIGRKKAFIEFNNQTFLQIIHRRVSRLTNKLVVVIDKEDRNEAVFKELPKETKVVHDLKQGIGPVMGMYSGMRHLFTEYALVLPCDSLFVHLKLLKKLIQSAKGFDAAIPKWPNNFVEPLHSVYHLAPSIKAIEEALDKGEKRVSDIIKRLEKINYIPVDSLREFDPTLLTFMNINYLDELNNMKKMHEKNVTVL